MKIEKEVGYSDNVHNYICESEITVTITLSEYRELVSTKATFYSKVSEVERDKYERESENRKLNSENKELKLEVYELKKRIEDYESKEETKTSSEIIEF